MNQSEINISNKSFWSELCGTVLAKQLKITKIDKISLAKFDTAYFEFYPFLKKYIDKAITNGGHVLEIGLGYGSVGNYIARNKLVYSGLDISDAPVNMMNTRLEFDKIEGQSIVGSALDIPFNKETFDSVVSIGCLHHTGNLQRAIDEVHRVLKPGGQCLIMVYSNDSIKVKLLNSVIYPLKSIFKKIDKEEQLRAAYDAHLDGEAAPETVFSSLKEIEYIFRNFSIVKCSLENCDQLPYVPYSISKYIRFLCLKTYAKRFGSDIYIQATK